MTMWTLSVHHHGKSVVTSEYHHQNDALDELDALMAFDGHTVTGNLGSYASQSWDIRNGEWNVIGTARIAQVLR